MTKKTEPDKTQPPGGKTGGKDAGKEKTGGKDAGVEKETLHWLVRPRTIRLMWWWGVGLLATLTAVDFVIEGHPLFLIDGIFGFYSWYGFLTCGAMVFFAKGLGLFIERRDTYYEEGS